MNRNFSHLNELDLRLPSRESFSETISITPAENLIIRKAGFFLDQQVTFLGIGQGIAASLVCMQNPTIQVDITDLTCSSLEWCSKILELNNIHNASLSWDISMLPEKAGSKDAVFIFLPKGRNMLRRWLVEAYNLLKPGGKFYLVGANNLGIKSAVKDLAEISDEILVLGYRKGNRLVSSTRLRDMEIPSWCKEHGIQPGTWINIEDELDGMPLRLVSLPGVFSAEKLDEGTRFLLQNLPVVDGKTVLDFGCGNGVIGLTARRLGAAKVDMVDHNLFAISCARRNINASGFSEVQAYLGNGLDDLPRNGYDLILSNPPFHHGKKVDYSTTEKFIQDSYHLLKPGSKLILVANQFIRYDRLLNTTFDLVNCVSDNNSFRIWEAIKSSHRAV